MPVLIGDKDVDTDVVDPGADARRRELLRVGRRRRGRPAAAAAGADAGGAKAGGGEALLTGPGRATLSDASIL